MSGDWAVQWVRRTRYGGDSWEGLEVPLGEDAELYRLDILDALDGAGAAQRRDVVAGIRTYTAAMQTDDFGAPRLGPTWRGAGLVCPVAQSYPRCAWRP